MSEAQRRLEGEAQRRRVWSASEEFENYLDSWSQSQEERLRQEINSNARFATEYYRGTRFTAGLHAIIHYVFLFVCISFQIGAIILSSLGDVPVGVIVSKVLGGFGGIVAAVFQCYDATMPMARLKLYHGIFSGISLAMSMGINSYELGISRPDQGKDVTHRCEKISQLLTFISNFLLCVNCFHLVFKTIASALENATWKEYLSLLRFPTPHQNMIWESLPDSEKIWVMRIYLEKLLKKFRSSYYAGSASSTTDPSPSGVSSSVSTSSQPAPTSRGAFPKSSSGRVSLSSPEDSSSMPASRLPRLSRGRPHHTSHNYPLRPYPAGPSRSNGGPSPAATSPGSPSITRQRAVK